MEPDTLQHESNAAEDITTAESPIDIKPIITDTPITESKQPGFSFFLMILYLKNLKFLNININ